MKKVVAFLCVVAVSAIMIFSFGGCLNKKSIWLENVDITATVNSDGSLSVSERWETELSGSRAYRNLYKDISLFDGEFNTKSDLTVESVYYVEEDKYFTENTTVHSMETSEDIPETYYEWYRDDKTDNKVEIGVIMPRMSKGIYTFVYKYKLSNFVGGYTDVAQLYLKMFSEDFNLDITNFKMALTLPSGGVAETQYWLHTTVSGSNISKSGDVITATASNIPKHTQVEVRAITDKSIFSASIKQSSGKNREGIVAEEAKFAKDYADKLVKEYNIAVLNVSLCAITAVFCIVVVVVSQVLNRKVKGVYPEYAREIPEGWSAAELGHLFYYYDGGVEKSNLRGRMISATVLELARRDYIEIQSTDKDGEFLVDVKKDLIADKLADLKPHELVIYQLLGDVESSYGGAPFSMAQFEKYGKNNAISVNNAMKEFVDLSKKKFSSAHFVGKVASYQKAAHIGSIIMIVAGVATFIFGLGLSYFSIALALGGLLLSIGMPKRAKLTKAGEAEFASAQGLKKYMLDFSNIKEYDIPKLILWEEYLVYATMMGISKEVIKNLKLVYKEFSEQSESGIGYPMHSYLFTYMWLANTSSLHNGAMFDLGSKFDQSITNLSNTVNTLSLPKGGGSGFGGGGFGGGGFGGGGGGFGGGGGGAR